MRFFLTQIFTNYFFYNLRFKIHKRNCIFPLNILKKKISVCVIGKFYVSLQKKLKKNN